jgi:hypothetical protein
VRLPYYGQTDSLRVEFQGRPSIDTREIAADLRRDLDAERLEVRVVQPA